MIYVNIYLENKEKILHKEKVPNKSLQTIEDARIFCFSYLKDKYNEVKYKVQLQPKKEYSILNIIFERDISLNREFIINKIIND
jgi:hypothetical protein